MGELNNTKRGLTLVLFCFFFSCQSLKTHKNKSQQIQTESAISTFQGLKMHKNKAQQSSVSRTLSLKMHKNKAQQMPKSPVIDKNYLEYLADSAYLKAETAFLENKTQHALEHIKTAQIFLGEAHFIERKADFYKKEGLLTTAIYYYKKLLKKYGEQSRIQKKIMECYVLNDLNHLALKENEKLLQKETESFLLWFQKSILLIGEKRWEESLKVFQRLLSKDRTLDEKAQILAFQSYVLSQLHQEAEALVAYHQLLALNFPQESVVLRIAELYKKIGKESWAIFYVSQYQIKKGITKYNSSFLFDVAFSTGDWKQAFLQTKNLELLGNLETEHRFYRAFYLGELQKHDRSIPYLKDLLSETPKKGQYQYMLAVSYAKSNQLEQALKTYKEISLSSPYFLVSRLEQARLLEKQGKYKKSLSLLKALAFGKTISPSAVHEYAKSLWRLGDRKKALFVLTSALKQIPNNSELLSLKATYSKKTSFANSTL